MEWDGDGFPRHQKRGPIEAFHGNSEEAEQDAYFRAIKSAVPLKQSALAKMGGGGDFDSDKSMLNHFAIPPIDCGEIEELEISQPALLKC